MLHQKVNDISMYYEIHGSGDPIVLIMGLSSSHALFYRQIPVFSDHLLKWLIGPTESSSIF